MWMTTYGPIYGMNACWCGAPSTEIPEAKTGGFNPSGNAINLRLQLMEPLPVVGLAERAPGVAQASL